jgi:hypothetical protein
VEGGQPGQQSISLKNLNVWHWNCDLILLFNREMVVSREHAGGKIQKQNPRSSLLGL